MKPNNLKTKVFLDSGDPKETRMALDVLGFLDGQTTNPSLIAKNPDVAGKKFTPDEIYYFYKKVVREISEIIPNGSVSIEVYADAGTKAEEMFKQGKEFFGWIPNAHIKYPTTHEGLKAAEMSVRAGMRVNMTLVFSQEQAAAVYTATRGAKKGDVFVSPFVGRLDDRGENGMDLIRNIAEMYKNGDGHVEILTASIRSLGHFIESVSLGADINTAPIKVLREWAERGMPLELPGIPYPESHLQPISYQETSLGKPWQDYNIHHELTDKGMEKFAADWNALIG